MVIGHGDIASVLPERSNLLFFASGVSNSQETRESEYDREKALLTQAALRRGTQTRLVYFSSLAVFYGTGRYVDHKRDMEQRVKGLFRNHTIIRIGNITWGSNPHTLINFMRNKIAKGEPIDIQDTYRYVVDLPEFLHWIDLIPNWNVEMNVPGRMLKVEEIVKLYGYS